MTFRKEIVELANAMIRMRLERSGRTTALIRFVKELDGIFVVTNQQDQLTIYSSNEDLRGKVFSISQVVGRRFRGMIPKPVILDLCVFAKIAKLREQIDELKAKLESADTNISSAPFPFSNEDINKLLNSAMVYGANDDSNAKDSEESR